MKTEKELPEENQGSMVTWKPREESIYKRGEWSAVSYVTKWLKTSHQV